MTGHVDRLLNAYISGQLDQSQATQVYLHINTCSRCRIKLLRTEELDRHLKSTLSVWPVASGDDVSRWWQNIRAGQPIKVSRREYQVLASIALAAVFIFVPVLASWSYTFPMAQPESVLSAQATELIVDTMTIDVGEGQYFAPYPAAARVLLQATVSPVVPVSAAPSPLASVGR